MLSRCSPRCAPAVCSRRTGRTGTNREGTRVRSYIPGSAMDQTRCWPKRDYGLPRLCYGLRLYILSVALEVLRCIPMCPNTTRLCPGHRRQSPGVTTASHGSRTAKPWCYMVAYEYQWNFRGTYDRYVICKVQNSSYIPRQRRAAIRVVEKIGNGVINETLPSYTRLRRIKKLLRIIQIIWLKI